MSLSCYRILLSKKSMLDTLKKSTFISFYGHSSYEAQTNMFLIKDIFNFWHSHIDCKFIWLKLCINQIFNFLGI